MKQRIAPGATLETVTPDELVAALASIAPEPEKTVRAASQGKTDVAGALALDVYEVPPGMVFELNRVLVESDGSTPAAPFVNAAGFIDVTVDGRRRDFAAMSIPALSTDGSHAAVKALNGEKVGVVLTGGPVSGGVTVTIQGRLYPHGGTP